MRSKDPLINGFERYINLEHLVPGDLRAAADHRRFKYPSGAPCLYRHG